MGRESRRYRVYENDKLLGEFTCKEIEAMTGCPAKSVCSKANQGTFHKKRYLFERTDEGNDPESYFYEFKQAWNEARIRAYKKDGRDAQICDYCGRIIEGAHLTTPGYGTEPCRHFHYACFRDKRNMESK